MKVTFNPSFTQIAALVHYGVSPMMYTYIFTMNAIDGSSINHHYFPNIGQSHAPSTYDMQEMLFYDNTGKITVGFYIDYSYNILSE